MDTKDPSPQTTLVVLLGASEWPLLPGFQRSEAFANAAKELSAYFLEPRQFGLPPENLLDRFNADKSADDLDAEIGQFLEQRIESMKATDYPAKDVLLYYVGHGGFVGDDSDFYLAIRRTRMNNPLSSGLQMKSLAHTLTESARYLRRIIILDCCFAAAAFSAFQSEPAQIALKKTKDAFEVRYKTVGFPSKGTTLLCSSGHKSPSMLLPDASSTMFSKGLLAALMGGREHQEDRLSLREVKELAIDSLYEIRDAPRPVVLSPDQSEGDVADIPFFPNLWIENERLRRDEEERLRKTEEEKERLRKAEEEKKRLRKAEEEKERVRKAEEEKKRLRKAEEDRHRQAEEERWRKAREEQARKAQEEQARLAEVERVRKAEEEAHLAELDSIEEPLLRTCLRCGTPNADGARFCGACGTSMQGEERYFTPPEHPIVQNYPTGKLENEIDYRSVEERYFTPPEHPIVQNYPTGKLEDETDYRSVPEPSTFALAPLDVPFRSLRPTTSTPRTPFLESVGDFLGEILEEIGDSIDDIGWGVFFFGVFDVLVVPISLGLWQKNWWIFLGSLLCSVILLIWHAFTYSNIKYLIVIIFAISWGLIGWLIGSQLAGIFQTGFSVSFDLQQHLITWGEILAGAITVIVFFLGFFVHRYMLISRSRYPSRRW